MPNVQYSLYTGPNSRFIVAINTNNTSGQLRMRDLENTRVRLTSAYSRETTEVPLKSEFTKVYWQETVNGVLIWKIASVCRFCEDWHLGNTHLCKSCRERGVQLCSCCGEEYTLDYTCENCASMSHCEECGDWYDTDDHEGCPHCYRLIHPYHWSHNQDYKFLPHSSAPVYFGIELEVDHFPDPHEAAKRISSASPHIWLEDDCSLNSGIEIISHPATLDFHKTQLGWEKVIDACKKSHGKGDTASTAGLHIHFTKSFLTSTEMLKLVLLFCKHKQTLITLSRRVHGSNNNAKFHFISYPFNESRPISYNYYDRYEAVNLTNRNTIEIRLFQSTLVPGILYGALEFTHAAANLVKTMPAEEINTLSWKPMESALLSHAESPDILDNWFSILRKEKQTNSCVS